MHPTTLALLGLALSSSVGPTATPPARWTARWIAPPDATGREFGVFHFRRTVELRERPGRFVVHVTADNRYELFVNGARLAWGPARSDPHHWQYDTIDLAPALRAGRNVIAALVWNFGEHRSLAQMSHRTGLLVQGEGPDASAADTGTAEWKVLRSGAYAPAGRPHQVVNGGERFDGRLHVWGWTEPDFDDAAWPAARPISRPHLVSGSDSDAPWELTPRRIPFMEETPQRFRKVRRTNGPPPPEGFPEREVRWELPARTEAVLLLDQAELTTAFPELVVSGGAGAEISLRYAEALHAPGKPQEKGHRDEIDGKTISGHQDHFVAGGGRRQLLRPLFWRTFRYVELRVTTREAPLVIDDVRNVYTGYPFRRRARFEGGPPPLARILDVGWRTARLCAHETYMDCPYYEQLQYVGDTRIQALVSLYTAGDAHLVRNALLQLDHSRIPEGLTQSRYPSFGRQLIPTFSLLWIGMLHDFHRYQDDPAFVRDRLPGVRAVLAYFQALQRPDGSLGPGPWWNFVDWAQGGGWTAGVPPGWSLLPSWAPADPRRRAPADPTGASSLLDLHVLLALQWAADLEEAVGNPALARDHRAAAARLSRTITRLYFDEARGLFADTAARTQFSQHANSLAVLAGIVRGAEARRLMTRVLDDATLTRASIYFRHYVASAMNAAGLGDRYLDSLGEWHAMLARGLTTWSETADPTRSDCHAWGASPNFEIFRTVLGIDSAAPGFRRVLIRPFLGALADVSGSIPHPRGEIRVRLRRTGRALLADVSLPEQVPGQLVWNGHRLPLRPGQNLVRVPEGRGGDQSTSSVSVPSNRAGGARRASCLQGRTC